MSGQVKWCGRCNSYKPLSDFYKGSDQPDGYKTPCKDCVRKRVVDYQRKKYSTPQGRAKQMFQSAKLRSKLRGIRFNICWEHVYALLLKGVCPKTGFKFDLNGPTSSKVTPFGPAIDRKYAKRGYEPDNIQVVCNMFNMGKSDHDELDFIAMCVAVAERHRDDPAVIARLKELRGE